MFSRRLCGLGGGRFCWWLMAKSWQLVSPFRPGDSVVYGLAAGEAFAGVVPVRDSLFTQFPAQQNSAAFHLAGEIEQSDVEVFHLDSGGVDFGEGVFDALDGFLALRFAPRHL